MAGKKNDRIDGKPMWELIPMDAVEKVVEVMTYGANKYGPNKWQGLNDFNNRYYAAAMRHLTKWRSGCEVDPESGMTHLSHAACNLIFLLWNEINGKTNK